VKQCPVQAIDFVERARGEWKISETRHGPMVHARLDPGAENSGKLVSQVRDAALTLAKERGAEVILIDGPPGVGCSVIASITGVSLVVVVTEPTLSGEHDLKRVLDLTRHFDIPAVVCVNKWDVNPEQTEQIEKEALCRGARPIGRIRYDRMMTAAQIQGKAVVELPDSTLGTEIRTLWESVRLIE
jgi:MinD superfamily P-loop ATPase